MQARFRHGAGSPWRTVNQSTLTKRQSPHYRWENNVATASISRSLVLKDLLLLSPRKLLWQPSIEPPHSVLMVHFSSIWGEKRDIEFAIGIGIEKKTKPSVQFSR